jgi:hypothetical protein
MFRTILCSSSGGQIVFFTASSIVTLCKKPYSAPVESGLTSLSTGALEGRLQGVTIPDTVTIQFDLLRTSIVLLETCLGL